MSLRPYAQHHFGLVIRQDPVTGALLTPVWAGDEVLSVADSYPDEIATHPLEKGGIGPTDAVLLHPAELQVQIRISNAYRVAHPRPDWIGADRAQRAVAELREIQRQRQPVAVLVRGHNLLRNYLLGPIQASWPLDKREVTVSFTVREARLVTLQTSAVEQDGDLLAVGSQSVELGAISSPA